MSDFVVCDLIFIFFRMGIWGTRLSVPMAERMEDAIEHTPEHSHVADSRDGRLIATHGLARRQPGQRDDLSVYRA